MTFVLLYINKSISKTSHFLSLSELFPNAKLPVLVLTEISSIKPNIGARPERYLFAHYIHGLHGAARHEAVVPGEDHRLLQCHIQGTSAKNKTG